METLRIEILDPKVKKLLKDLANLNLIKIGKEIEPKVEFQELLCSLRSKSETAPSLDEITREVEEVRSLRYATKTK